ncbi:hypothetical protein MKW94_013258 [Papaver nudicaule]|uniref:Uncharacterized protein n=1 Tax=Papaver nudicaule TaxID=74823 RepID=A0AA41RWS6_PAPNU|nr:hypothetical protein [Papaver nudicaule]
MSISSKQKMMPNYTCTQMIPALILCLLLLGEISYSVKAAGRVHIGYGDCSDFCISKKYYSGICVPNKMDQGPLGHFAVV